ncbi:putative wall-associated receptor kinase-like 16 [Mercurialis annua]|uniref:putative wall-associated receptor kinase-like 16 n=1 Tax=Mercurialis annua TaxID=3986 RepID=UPI0021604178|nr:putative wall-associated receptor kinase-like 16 [Mercurialis annua]
MANYRVLVVLVLISVLLDAALAQTKPGCPNHCGDVTIPYPFGVGEGCYLDQSFQISCNSSSNKPYLHQHTNATVLDISVESGELRVLSQMVSECYDDSYQTNWILLNFSPFTVSSTRNKMVAVGCDTVAAVSGLEFYNVTGCFSLCSNLSDVNSSCIGKGCCETTISQGNTEIAIVTNSYQNYTNVSTFSPCSYAFVVEQGNYTFSFTDLLNLKNGKEFPVILDWGVGNITCEKAQRNKEKYACKENSECFDPDNAYGYRCICSVGYQGNPYLPHGCQGTRIISEKPNLYCNYIAYRQYLFIFNDILFVGVSIGILILLLAVSWLYFVLRKRRLLHLKEKYFQENGGYLFMQKNSGQNSTKAAKIYTENDLKKATDNFHESQILGKGGQGIVYKGTLPDNQIVAVKKSKIGDDTQVEGFINEVMILSQINHRNIVKLLGCCLETQVPLLVYEFVTNGTLFDHIHSDNGTNGRILIPWETRLRIATEVAEALSYMHSAASTPIIHRDIKSANILLDKNYTAKVSDFGASKLIPLDKSELTTLVQGTFGYLDPEYFYSSQLTEKSDVYSFGVVLIELLTRKKPISFTRIEEERNLAMYFVTSIQENRLLQVVDYLLINEKNNEDIKRVAMLAKRCVSVRGDERPKMKDVAIELRGLCSTENHPWEKNDLLCEQETQGLLPNSSKNAIDAMNDSIVKSVIFEIGRGR